MIVTESHYMYPVHQRILAILALAIVRKAYI